jgi:hypothetical protein
MGGEYLNTREVFLLPLKEQLVVVVSYLIRVIKLKGAYSTLSDLPWGGEYLSTREVFLPFTKGIPCYYRWLFGRGNEA